MQACRRLDCVSVMQGTTDTPPRGSSIPPSSGLLKSALILIIYLSILTHSLIDKPGSSLVCQYFMCFTTSHAGQSRRSEVRFYKIYTLHTWAWIWTSRSNIAPISNIAPKKKKKRQKKKIALMKLCFPCTVFSSGIIDTHFSIHCTEAFKVGEGKLKASVFTVAW